MGGIGCLLTGARAISQATFRVGPTLRRAGRVGCRSIRRSRITCKKDSSDRTPFASSWNSASWCAELPIPGLHGLYRTEQTGNSDRRTRIRCSGNCMVGPRIRRVLASVLDERAARSQKAPLGGLGRDRRLLDEHATFVRETEQELKASAAQKNTSTRCRICPPGTQAKTTTTSPRSARCKSS